MGSTVADAPAQDSQPKRAPPRAPGRGALAASAGILASRLVGLLRQRVVAHYLGTTDVAGVVAVAFQVGNITQNLLGEGTLSASFIPVYAKLRAESPDKAKRFAQAALGLLLAVTLFATVLFTLAAPLLAAVIASGFKEQEQLDLTIRMTRILFPMTGVLVVGAWSLGVLNAHRRFFLPYVAPVIWSLAQIAALVVGSYELGLTGSRLAIALAWGALAGAVLQVVVMIPTVRSLLGGIRPVVSPRTEGVHEAAIRLPGALAGRGIMLLSGLIDTWLVTFLGSGANSVLQYAQNIYLLPMSLLGTGEAAAALLDLSEHGTELDAEERNAKMRASLGVSLSRLVALSAVSTAVFAGLGNELITLLLQNGRFDEASTQEVAIVLATYSFGLPGNAICRLLTTASYALGDTKRPPIYAGVRVIVSTAISVALMRPLGVPGVVLGAVVAAWVELFLLAGFIREKIGGIGMDAVPLVRIGVVCAVTVSTGLAVRYALPPTFAHQPLGALIVLAGAGLSFAASSQSLGVLSLRSLLRR